MTAPMSKIYGLTRYHSFFRPAVWPSRWNSSWSSPASTTRSSVPLRMKQHAGDAKWVARVPRAGERAKDMQAMIASPNFRTFWTTMLPAETLATVQRLPSADRVLAQVRQGGNPDLE